MAAQSSRASSAVRTEPRVAARRAPPDTKAGFAARVLAAVRRIPVGRVATYGDIAALAGQPRACRAVGNVMRACRETGVPCHRVVAAGGRLGGFGGSPVLKRELLRAEGLVVVGRQIRQFDQARWRRPEHPAPQPRAAARRRGRTRGPRPS